MHRILCSALAATLWLATSACVIGDMDGGPEKTYSESIQAGKVENVRVDVHMGAGEMRIEGGSTALVDANFRYSENLGRPNVSYDATGFRGRLRIDQPKQRFSAGHTVNEWNLKFGGQAPLDFAVHLGAGESKLDLSKLPLRSVEVHMGVGALELNLDGNYQRDLQVEVHGGVGEAKIRLPRQMGVIADATGGIGSIQAHGMQKRGGDYVNDAYSPGKPAIRLKVRGGVGEIRLSVGE